MPNIIDGSDLELRNVRAWRRKLGIVDSGETRTIETRVNGRTTSSTIQLISADQLPARLAAFAVLDEAGYIVQTSTSPPRFAGRNIVGTPSQINVVNSTGINGNTRLSLPQNIHSGATPLFWQLSLASLTPERVVVSNEVNTLVSSSVSIDELETLVGIAGLTGILHVTAGSPVDAFVGTANYVPKWSAAAPFLTATSLLYDDGTHVGIGTTVPSVLLDLGLAGTRLGVIRLAGSTSGNVTIQPAAIAGTWTLTLPTTDGAANEFLQTDGAGVTSWAVVDLTTDVTGTLPVGNGGTGAVALTGIVQGTGTASLTGITGTANYVPKWSATAPYLTGTSNIIDDGTVRTTAYLGVNIVPLVPLHLYRSGVNGLGAASVLLLDTDAKTIGDETGFMFRALESANTTVYYGGIFARIDDPTVGSYDGSLVFKVAFNGTLPDRAYLTATGNFGIGSNPDLMFAEAYQLVVGSGSGGQGITIYAGTGYLSRMHFADGITGDQQYRGYIAYNHAIDAFQIGTAAAEAVRITSTGNVGIGTAAPGSRLHAYIQDASTIATTTVATLDHSSTGTPGISFGAQLLFALKSSITESRDAGAINVAWTDATDATRTSVMFFRPTNSGTMATQMALSGAGGLSVGDAIATMPNGVVNVVTGFRVNLSATAGYVLMGDGTNIVLQALPVSTHTILDAAVHTDSVTQTVTRGSLIYGNATPLWDELLIGAANRVLRSNGTDVSWAQVNLGTDVTQILGVANGGTNKIAFTDMSVIFYDGAAVSFQEDAGNFTYDTTTKQLTLTRTVGITQLDTYGLKLVNITPSVAGAANQQWSPPLVWGGEGWKSDAVTSSMKVEFRAYVATVSATGAPTGYWVLDHSVNDVAYTELLRADTTGYLRITKNALASIDTTLGQSAFGLQINNDTAATGGVTTQDAPPIIFKGAAWNSSALTSQDWRWRMLMKGVTVAGTTRSYVRLDSGTGGSNFGNPIVFTSAGGLSVGSVLESAFGVTSTQVGFQIAGGATAGTFLRGNGTVFLQAAIGPGDVPVAAHSHVMLTGTAGVHTDTLIGTVVRGDIIYGNSTPLWARLAKGAANTVLRANATDVLWGQVVLTTDVTGVLPIANGGTNASSFSDDGIVYYDTASTALKNRVSATQYLEYTGELYLTVRRDVDGDPLFLDMRNLDTTAATNAAANLAGTLSTTAGVAIIAGLIAFRKEQSWTGVAGTQDGFIRFETVLDGARTEALDIRSSGSIVCGKNSTLLSRTEDFLYLCPVAGAPTGVPTAFGARIPMTIDDTSATKRVYFYVGGAWLSAVIA